MANAQNTGMNARPDMTHKYRLPGQRRHPLQIVAACLALLSLACAPAHAGTAKQRLFEAPEQAGDALARAWHDGGKAGLLEIFGPSGMKLVSSGDPVAEKAARSRLAEEYDAGHSIETIDDQKALLILGRDEFPYPIPIVRSGNAWRFDTKAGEQEIIDRRIGRNELNAIRVCRTYVQAQREFAAEAPGNDAHVYATKVVSGAGKHDGLYWPVANGEQQSPLGPLFAQAAAEGYGPATNANSAAGAPYHGYRYRILSAQGIDGHAMREQVAKSFALVAYPAKYGDSGVMTFIINQHGIVFEKNLGPDTARIAQKMPAYNPDHSWKPVAHE